MNRVPSAVPILTAAAMRAAEDAAFAAGAEQAALMERAGLAVAQAALRFLPGEPVLVLAGPGNNGGDAYVAARHLRAAGRDVCVAALGSAREGAAVEMRARWQGETVPLAEATPRPLVVDGLFGTGITRPLEEAVAGPLRALLADARFVVAIDVPSGFDTDSGASFGSPLVADCTVALGALKPVHLIGDGRGASGAVLPADLGIAVPSDWHSLGRPALSPPAPDAQKYTRGFVLAVEGAMPGAARLAARAALAGGAGYVMLAGDDPASGGPDALVRHALDDMAAFDALLDDERVGAVVIGPGLGRDDTARARARRAIESDRPLVLDGDALSLFGEDLPGMIAGREAPIWLTPHSGEFGRVFGSGEGSKIARTIDAARTSGAIVVHKGPDTVIADPSGAVVVGADAPSWLSTAGTGDLLAGLIGAQAAARPDARPIDCAAAALWLHGRAAELAGPAFYADRLIDRISQAMGECL